MARLQVEVLEDRTLPTAIAMAVAGTHLTPQDPGYMVPMVFELESNGSLRYFLSRTYNTSPLSAHPVLISSSSFVSISAGETAVNSIRASSGDGVDSADVVAVDHAGGLWFYADGMSGLIKIGQNGFRSVDAVSMLAVDTNGAIWQNVANHSTQMPTTTWKLLASNGFVQVSDGFALDTAGNIWEFNGGGFTPVTHAGGFTDIVDGGGEFIDSAGNIWHAEYAGLVKEVVDSSTHVSFTSLATGRSLGDPHMDPYAVTDVYGMDTQGRVWRQDFSIVTQPNPKFELVDSARWKVIASDFDGMSGALFGITTDGVAGGDNNDGVFQPFVHE